MNCVVTLDGRNMRMLLASASRYNLIPEEELELIKPNWRQELVPCPWDNPNWMTFDLHEVFLMMMWAAVRVSMMNTTGLLLTGQNSFGPPSLLVEGLLSTGFTPSSFYLFVEMGLPVHLYSAFMW